VKVLPIFLNLLGKGKKKKFFQSFYRNFSLKNIPGERIFFIQKYKICSSVGSSCQNSFAFVLGFNLGRILIKPPLPSKRFASIGTAKWLDLRFSEIFLAV